VFIGSNNQPFELIFDTGSNWLWVNGRFCEDCNDRPRFDERESTTFKFYDVLTDLHYGSGDVYGYNSFDTVCIKPGSCADDFSFVAVGSQDGLDALASSGILGLSPRAEERANDLFIMKMKSSGVIDKAIFSLMIEFHDSKSKMTFGGIDLVNLAALGSKLVYHEIDEEQKWWTLPLQKMTLSSSKQSLDNIDKYIFGVNQKIIVDSGTSFLLMP